MAKKKKIRIKKDYVWLIAYVNADFISKVSRELSKFDDIEAYIPVVKVLKKKFKGKEEYDDIPLLFNYGFFKMSKAYAHNPEFLLKLQEHVSCLSHWVKDSSKVSSDVKVGTRKDLKKLAPIATATEQEVFHLMQVQEELSIYSNHELYSIKEGDTIILQGYPFEGLPAKVIHIDAKKKEVKVEITQKMFGKATVKEVKVNFQNVFYTIYKSGGYDDSLSNHLSFDEISQGRGINKNYTGYEG